MTQPQGRAPTQEEVRQTAEWLRTCMTPGMMGYIGAMTVVDGRNRHWEVADMLAALAARNAKLLREVELGKSMYGRAMVVFAEERDKLQDEVTKLRAAGRHFRISTHPRLCMCSKCEDAHAALSPSQGAGG